MTSSNVGEGGTIIPFTKVKIIYIPKKNKKAMNPLFFLTYDELARLPANIRIEICKIVVDTWLITNNIVDIIWSESPSKSVFIIPQIIANSSIKKKSLNTTYSGSK